VVQQPVVNPVRWSLVKVEDRSGGVLACTLGNVMQSIDLTYPKGESQAGIREAHVKAWKECAEQTLYRISLSSPEYHPPLDRLSEMLSLLKADRANRRVRFMGQIVQPRRLRQFGGVGHLIAIHDDFWGRNETKLAIWNFDSYGNHLQIRSAVHELEAVQFLRMES
jgi:hypothetical protein